MTDNEISRGLTRRLQTAKFKQQAAIEYIDFLTHAAQDIFEILEERTTQGSTLIVSQVPVENWYDIIAAPTIADAIIDRLVHNVYRIDMQEESMRKKLSKLTTENNY